MANIDGNFGVLARGGPRRVWDDCPAISIQGIMEFDTADINRVESSGALPGLSIHEMGHVIGVG